MSEFNNSLLGRVVTWAAAENMKRENADKAIALGLVKETDKRIPGWRQSEWGVAKRNGECQTAFCLAGKIVAESDEYMPLMEWTTTIVGGDHEVKRYTMTEAVQRDAIPSNPEDMPDWADLDFGMLWLDNGYETGDDVVDAVIPAHAVRTVHAAAVELLGLDDLNTGREFTFGLFGGGNNIREVVCIARAIAEGYGQTLDVPVWVMEEYGPKHGYDFSYITETIMEYRSEMAS